MSQVAQALYSIVEAAGPEGITRAQGLTVPSDGASGYAIGCVFRHSDGSAGGTLYINEGTSSSCDFNAVLTSPTTTTTTLTATTATIPTLDINTITTAVETAEHGAGVIGTGAAPATYRYSVNGTIITEIKIDLQGLASVATANDVIGLSAGGNAYIGRNVVATNGIIYKIELICLETPSGGDNDVNVVVNSSGTLAYDGAGGTTYGVNGGDAVAGQVIENLVQGLTANHYFYLTAGTGDTAAAYTAGMFIVRLHGHALLA
jgi:hypothetical protein